MDLAVFEAATAVSPRTAADQMGAGAGSVLDASVRTGTLHLGYKTSWAANGLAGFFLFSIKFELQRFFKLCKRSIF